MPKGKLKAALATHTVNAQRYAAAKKAAEHKHDKEASVKASMSGAKKAAKRRARAEGRAAEAVKGGQGVQGPRQDKLAMDGTENKGVEGDEESGEVEAGAPSTSTSTSTASATITARPTIPFNKKDTILLLGEANFSYALSIIQHYSHPGYQMLATSYDSEETCYFKYPDAEANVKALKEAGAGVEFGVDGGKLEACKKAGKGRWSRVIMNFPHTGMSLVRTWWWGKWWSGLDR